MTAAATTQTPNQTAAENDLEVILPTVETLEVDGIPVRVERLKFRELTLILRILTRGVKNSDMFRSIDMSGGANGAWPQILAMLVFAIPEAPDEFVTFLKAVTKAKDGRQAKNLDAALDNPDLDTMTDVLAIVWEQEQDEFGAIVGKLVALFNGQMKQGVNASKGR